MEPLQAKQVEGPKSAPQNISQDYLLNLFAGLFQGPVSNSKALTNVIKEPEKRIVFYFKEGSGVEIPLSWVEKLRNESKLLKGLSFDKEIQLREIKKDAFLAIISIFYPEYTNRPNVETKHVLEAADYLQVSSVSKHELSRLTKRIESFKDEAQLIEAFEIYTSISKYPFS